jgi:RNA polymerase sigma-70 factor (ECF subfamily)
MKNKMKLITIIAMTVMIAFVAMAQTAREVSVKSMSPSVVKTLPEAGTTDVDPALTEIKVTFSKDMITDRMWSVCQISNETFPEVGSIHYLSDKRTCIVPVKLQPGKTYVLWFNNGKFNAFRDTEHHSCIPYMLVFETKK